MPIAVYRSRLKMQADPKREAEQIKELADKLYNAKMAQKQGERRLAALAKWLGEYLGEWDAPRSEV